MTLFRGRGMMGTSVQRFSQVIIGLTSNDVSSTGGSDDGGSLSVHA